MDRDSVLERLNLPSNFGYALLVLGLALLLAPYLRGSDFGIVKIPDFDAPVRRALRIVGPLVMLAAVMVHVSLFPTKLEPTGAPPRDEAPVGGAVRPIGPESAVFAVEPGASVLAPRNDGGCLYPATVLGRDGEAVRVRFTFGQDGRIPANRLVPIPTGSSPAIAPGDRVFAHLDQVEAWAPGEVKELREGRALIDLDVATDCGSRHPRSYVWVGTSAGSFFVLEDQK
jgi:hypothetical protein